MKRLHMMRTEKVRDDQNNIWHILAPSLLGISVCVLCLCGSSWAWFTAIQNSPVERIEAATYNLSVSVTEQNVDSQTVDVYTLTPDEQGNSSTDLEAGRSYLITLKADGTASGGYGRVAYGEDIYHTETIKSGDSISFMIHAEQSATLSVEAFWGSCAEEEQKCIGDGFVIGEAPTTSLEDRGTLPEEENKKQDENPEEFEENKDIDDSEEVEKEEDMKEDNVEEEKKSDSIINEESDMKSDIENTNAATDTENAEEDKETAETNEIQLQDNN